MKEGECVLLPKGLKEWALGGGGGAAAGSPRPSASNLQQQEESTGGVAGGGTMEAVSSNDGLNPASPSSATAPKKPSVAMLVYTTAAIGHQE